MESARSRLRFTFVRIAPTLIGCRNAICLVEIFLLFRRRTPARPHREREGEPGLIICLSRTRRTLSFAFVLGAWRRYAKPTPLETLLAHRNRPSKSPRRQFTFASFCKFFLPGLPVKEELSCVKFLCYCFSENRQLSLSSTRRSDGTCETSW